MRLLTATKALAGCALLVGFSTAGISLAQPPRPPRGHGPPPGPPPERFIEEHAERLGLGDETLEALHEIVDESRERGKGLRVELRDAHEKMRELLSQEEPDESAVMKQAEAIGELELEERKNRLRATLRIRALLTPEQREELVQIRKEERGRRISRRMGACRDDVSRICPDAQPGRASVQCLSEHWDALSKECQSAFEDKPRRGFGRRGRFRPPGP
jgi:Spy/CpxP family protein refolding chaperone